MRGNMHNFRLGRHAGYWKAIWQEPGYGQRRQTLYDEFNKSIKATEPKEKAERAYNAFCHRLRRAARPAEPTIGEILRGYVDDRKRAASHDRMEFALQALKPLHATTSEAFGISNCREYTAGRQAQEVSDGTIHYELSMLKTAFKWAVEEEWIAKIPKMEIPHKPQGRDRWLTRAEADRLIAAARSQHIRLFIIIGLTTAARKTAILELTWDRVDFENRRINFNPPIRRITSKRRAIVPINDTLYAALIEARKASTCDYVIEYAGGPVKDVKRGVRLTVERAGLKGVFPHILRHTSATWMTQQGAHNVGEFLGHKDPRSTQKYAHHHPDFLIEPAKALEL